MEFRVIPETQGFLAGDDGFIYTAEKIKRQHYRNGDGYLTSSVKTSDGRWITYGIQRLVALAWLSDSRSNERNEVNHRDCNIENNKPSNLEWVTSSENNIHSEIMRTDNQYITIIVEQNGCPINSFINAHDASKYYQIDILNIWDSIKNSEEINGLRFYHRPFSGKIPYHLKKYGRSTGKGIAIKTLDVDTGDIRIFDSFAEAAKEYDTSPSHLYQCLSKPGKVNLFRKKYQVAIATDDFPEISIEDLEKARNHGPRDTLAYNTKEKQCYIFNSAKEFIETFSLSKKAITTTLAKGTLREIDSWIVIYFTEENLKKLIAHIESPVSV